MQPYIVAGIFAVVIFVGVRTTHAATAGEGLYLGLYGGYAAPENFHDVRGGRQAAGLSFSDINLNSGFMAGFKVGWNGPASHAVGRFLGIELDGSYIGSNIKAQNGQASGADISVPVRFEESDLHLATGAVHLMLRYPGEVFQPYIGAGPAVVTAYAPDLTVRLNNTTARESAFAANVGFSGIAGFRVQVADHVSLFFEYKHIRSTLDFDALEGNAVINAGVGGIAFLFQ